MLSPVLTALERIIQADRQIPGVRPFRVNRVGLRFGPHFRSSPHHFDVLTVTSGFLSETDIVTDGRHVSNVPTRDVCARLTICPLQPEADVYVALGLRARLICVGGRR